jgi:hypothetical protein
MAPSDCDFHFQLLIGKLFSFDIAREAQRFVIARQITGDFYYQLANPVARRQQTSLPFSFL